MLRAVHPENEHPVEPGRLYVAPPDCHRFIEDGNVRLSPGPKENGHRPAIDPLFRSAAHHDSTRVIGVLLSGNLSDGTAGVVSIKQRGGIAVVQDPETALDSGMPRSAIQRVPVDHVIPVRSMAALLGQLTAQPVPSRKDVAMDPSLNDDGTLDEVALEDRKTQSGIPSTMSCPECHGVLWEHRDGDVLAFRCRVGTLPAARGARGPPGHSHSTSTFTEHAMDAEHHASTIRSVLSTGLRGKVTAASVIARSSCARWSSRRSWSGVASA